MDQTKTSKTIELSKPLETESGEITEVVLKKPTPPDMRGLQLSLIEMQDYDAMLVLIPRISLLTERDIINLEIEDFTAISVATLGFFVKMDS
ncbi:MAG: phage tail assembly protein [Thiomicrospira sp.]|nr:MAG: phage tail assembly protein [Thiomicrospira sp.]